MRFLPKDYYTTAEGMFLRIKHTKAVKAFKNSAILKTLLVAMLIQITLAQGEVKNVEFKAAADVIDAISEDSTNSIEATEEAEALRNLVAELVWKREIEGITNVLSTDPIERHSWQVVAKSIGGNVRFKEEQLPLLKSLFLASIRPGQHWLMGGRSGRRYYTSVRLRTELALQIKALMAEGDQVFDIDLLAEDPAQGLKIHMPDNTGEVRTEAQSTVLSSSVGLVDRTEAADSPSEQSRHAEQTPTLSQPNAILIAIFAAVVALLPNPAVKELKKRRHRKYGHWPWFTV